MAGSGGGIRAAANVAAIPPPGEQLALDPGRRLLATEDGGIPLGELGEKLVGCQPNIVGMTGET